MIPSTNTRLFGHEEAEARLFADAAAYKLPQGLIISGPRGIGKATLAYRFARALLAGEPDPNMAESHPVFKRVASGAHADMLVIEPAYDEKKEEHKRDISIEQAREIGKFLSLTPGESDWRVVIIDSADQLNVNAANAILKILEEPPPQAILLLISHNPGKLLPTIRSRCRTLKLAPLGGRAFAQAMDHLLPDADNIAALAELSGHAPGIAMEYMGQGAVEQYTELLAVASSMPALDARRVHAFAEAVASGSRHTNWQLFTRLALLLIERAARTASGNAPAPATPEEAEALYALAQLHPAAVWATKWQEASEQLSLAERLHLDYKQMVIAFFHSLASRDTFQLAA